MSSSLWVPVTTLRSVIRPEEPGDLRSPAYPCRFRVARGWLACIMAVRADSAVLRARGCAARCAAIGAPGGRACLVVSGGRCAGSWLGRGGGCPAAPGYPFLDLGEQGD